MRSLLEDLSSGWHLRQHREDLGYLHYQVLFCFILASNPGIHAQTCGQVYYGTMSLVDDIEFLFMQDDGAQPLSSPGGAKPPIESSAPSPAVENPAKPIITMVIFPPSYALRPPLSFPSLRRLCLDPLCLLRHERTRTP